MPKKKILVVDDEQAMTRMLKRSLEATGHYEVRTENSGMAAASAASEFLPDFILLDVMMPGLDGGDTAARIKEDARLANVPIVFLTAIIRRDEIGGVPAIERGGQIILPKPVRLPDLLECIEAYLGKPEPEEAPADDV